MAFSAFVLSFLPISECKAYALPDVVRKNLVTDLQREEALKFMYDNLRARRVDLFIQENKKMTETIKVDKLTKIKYIFGFKEDSQRVQAFIDILDYKTGKDNSELKQQIRETDPKKIKVVFRDDNIFLIIGNVTIKID